MALTVPSVDISEWQGAVDGGHLAAVGIRHVIVRCCDGGHFDPYYEANVQRCADAGLSVDTYAFVRSAHGSPVSEAQLYHGFASRAETHRLWLDCEGGTEGADDLAGWLTALVERLEDLGWRDRLGIYTNAAWWNPHVSPEGNGLGRLPWWVATYPTMQVPPADARDWEGWVARFRTPQLARPWSDYVGWQFSSSGTQVPGRRVDCNLFDEAFLYPPKSGPNVPTVEVAPMYDPPIANQPIVAACAGPGGKGALVLCADGGILIFGDAPVKPAGAGQIISPVGQPYFAGRSPARIEVDEATGEWTVTATSGERYTYPHG